MQAKLSALFKHMYSCIKTLISKRQWKEPSRILGAHLCVGAGPGGGPSGSCSHLLWVEMSWRPLFYRLCNYHVRHMPPFTHAKQCTFLKRVKSSYINNPGR